MENKQTISHYIESADHLSSIDLYESSDWDLDGEWYGYMVHRGDDEDGIHYCLDPDFSIALGKALIRLGESGNARREKVKNETADT